MNRFISRRRLVLFLCACGVTATALILRFSSEGVLVNLKVFTKVVNLRVDSPAEWESDSDPTITFLELWGPFNGVRFSSGDTAGALPCNGFYSAGKQGRMTLSGTLSLVQFGLSTSAQNVKVQFAQRGSGLVQIGFPESPGSSLHAVFQIPTKATGRCEMCRCREDSGPSKPDSDFDVSPGSSVELSSPGITRITQSNVEQKDSQAISLFKPFAVRNVSFVERRDGMATSALDSNKSTALIEGDRKPTDVSSLLEIRPRSGTELDVQKLAIRASDLYVEADGHLEAVVAGKPTKSRNLIPRWWFLYGHPYINLLFLALTWVDKAWEFVKKNLGIAKETGSLLGARSEKRK